MLPLQDLLERWMAGETLPGVDYALNDLVEVVDGAHAGERGTVITPVQFEPTLVFAVELSSGTDIDIAQSSLRPAG
jgi:hypothetical protein